MSLAVPPLMPPLMPLLMSPPSPAPAFARSAPTATRSAPPASAQRRLAARLAPKWSPAVGACENSVRSGCTSSVPRAFSESRTIITRPGSSASSPSVGAEIARRSPSAATTSPSRRVSGNSGATTCTASIAGGGGVGGAAGAASACDACAANWAAASTRMQHAPASSRARRLATSHGPMDRLRPPQRCAAGAPSPPGCPDIDLFRLSVG